MRKLLAILLVALMLISLFGCNKNTNNDTLITNEIEETNIIEETTDETIAEPTFGAYNNVEDGSLTDELYEIFNKATENLTGASYKPIELLATQVANGTNYKFLASGLKNTDPVLLGTYNITINKDSNGVVSLLDIEIIEEQAEEDDQIEENDNKEFIRKDPSELSFWVVFYNPDGHELQRTIQKYGTIPAYKGETPIYWDSDYYYNFICWEDRKGNEYKKFSPIVGNTYIYARYELGGPLKKNDSSEPTIQYHEQVQCLSSTGSNANISYIKTKVLGGIDMEFVFEAKVKRVNYCRIFGYYNNQTDSMLFQSTNVGSNYFEMYSPVASGSGIFNFGTISGFDYSVPNLFDIKYSSLSSFVKINGNTVQEISTTSSPVSPKEIFLFKLNRTDSSNNNFPLSIYYFKIYQNGALIRDFIPVKTILDIDKSKNATDPTQDIPIGTLCFYDNVEGKYYLNSGTQPFTDTPIS